MLHITCIRSGIDQPTQPHSLISMFMAKYIVDSKYYIIDAIYSRILDLELDKSFTDDRKLVHGIYKYA